MSSFFYIFLLAGATVWREPNGCAYLFPISQNLSLEGKNF